MEADTEADNIEVYYLTFRNKLTHQDASLIVKEISLILQCIERLFSWEPLHHPDNSDKLKVSLLSSSLWMLIITKTLLKIVTTKKPKPTRSQQASPLSQLVNVAYNYFDCFFQTISDFASARTLLGLLSAIVKCSPDSELVEKLSERAASILQRNWGDAKIKVWMHPSYHLTCPVGEYSVCRIGAVTIKSSSLWRICDESLQRESRGS